MITILELINAMSLRREGKANVEKAVSSIQGVESRV